jgi:adenylate cyclase
MNLVRPKYIRYAKQIIPFGIIWFIFALVYSLVELGLLGDLERYPTTGNVYSFQQNIIFILLFSFFMGLVQGAIEINWLRKLFERNALWVKVVLKSILYLLLIVVFLVCMTLMNTFFNSGEGEMINELKQFISVFSFWSIVIYISVIVGIAVFFSEISEYFGEDVFYKFFFGKYHQPIQEKRIFMFLDMKSSTTIAEEIGHKKYFNLLKDYYADLTDPILETFGEIYQYVGDEIVISWPVKKGIYKNNCVECFDKIYQVFEKRKAYYLKKYKVVPSFKAGYHIGEVTTGEIGIIKRDIIYTGDILNTTARIQGQCNNYNAKALISYDLLMKLPKKTNYSFNNIGTLTLRGKQEGIQLYRIDFQK